MFNASVNFMVLLFYIYCRIVNNQTKKIMHLVKTCAIIYNEFTYSGVIMKKILVASTNEKVINTVKASCQKYAAYFVLCFSRIPMKH